MVGSAMTAPGFKAMQQKDTLAQARESPSVRGHAMCSGVWLTPVSQRQTHGGTSSQMCLGIQGNVVRDIASGAGASLGRNRIRPHDTPFPSTRAQTAKVSPTTSPSTKRPRSPQTMSLTRSTSSTRTRRLMADFHAGGSAQ